MKKQDFTKLGREGKGKERERERREERCEQTRGEEGGE